MQLQEDFSTDLKRLNQELGADFAIISRIIDDDYEVIAVESELTNVQQGAHFVTQNTYCNEVIDTADMVTYEHVARIKAMVLHPIYTAMQLEAYIGEPIRYKNAIVGTLNFSGFDPKRDGFSEQEMADVKALARRIEAAIVPESL